MARRRQTWLELIRFGVVGVVTNLAGYGLYLLLTLIMDPKLAITFLYPTGALMGYFGHSEYSFQRQRTGSLVALRYIMAHACGYGLNFLLLFFLVDRLFWPHELVQAVAIVLVAGLLFLTFKFFVFVPPTPKVL